jgi:DinB superfamily
MKELTPTRMETIAMPNDAALRKHLVSLISGSEAHADFKKAVKVLPMELRGKTPDGAEHSPWELLEHLRIAQWDILDFSRNPDYKSLKWPEEYWPNAAAPPDDKAWEQSVQAFLKDQKDLCDLVSDRTTDLFAKIPHGDGQTILREALLAADHSSYHIGQLVLVRRLLGAWK